MEGIAFNCLGRLRVMSSMCGAGKVRRTFLTGGGGQVRAEGRDMLGNEVEGRCVVKGLGR